MAKRRNNPLMSAWAEGKVESAMAHVDEAQDELRKALSETIPEVSTEIRQIRKALNGIFDTLDKMR